MASNQFHLDIALLPDWQQEFIRQYKRVRNADAGFQPTGQGWFLLLLSDQPPTRRAKRVQGSRVREMSEELAGESSYQGDDTPPATPPAADDLPPALLAARQLAQGIPPPRKTVPAPPRAPVTWAPLGLRLH